MKKIVIFGLNDAAQVAYFYFRNDSDHTVCAFTVDKVYLNKKHFCDLPVIAFEEIESYYPPDEYSIFIAVGYTKVNSVRQNKYHEAKSKGYKVVSYISSKAVTWPGLEVGENCFILENNTIQPFVKIGDNVTLWSGNHIGHHSAIHDNCFIASHVVISGGVNVGKNCFIGVNATVWDHINIGDHCVIAAGSLVTKDTASGGVYIGQPARLLKKVNDDTQI